jgi:NarL family two-component system response regulator LiaR
MLGDISGMLGDISGTLGDISGTLGDISGTLGDISGTLGDISGDLGDISAMLGDISGDLGDISGDLGDISGAVVLCVNTHDRPAERVYHPFMRSVFLVDDHAIVRRGLETELTETGRFRIAGEASTLAEARYLLEALREPPDLVILDLELGDDNGLDLIGALQERGGRLPAVLVCSVFEDPFRIQTALHAGARGYVPKSAAGAEILAAADAVLGGKTWLAPHLKLKNAAAPDIYDIFTRQERNVLELVLKGLGNAAIAKKLGVKLRTVENYLSRIYAKTGVTTRSGLIALFTARPPH